MNDVIFIESVTDLFFKRGFKTLTMDEIASEFGMSKRTLYEQYGSKISLIERSIEITLLRLKKLFADIVAENLDPVSEFLILSTKVNTLIEVSLQPVLITQLQKYYPKIYKDSLKAKEEMVQDFILNNFMKGKKEGYYLKSIDAKVVAALFYFIREEMPKTKLGESENWVEYQQSFLEIFIRGIVTQKGEEILNTHT